MANHYDKFGRLISYTDANGNRYNANHEFIGYSKNGVHYDKNHQYIGYNKNGYVYDSNHEYNGRKR